MFEHPALRAVICNSPMVTDEIVQYYGVDRSKLHVIYNGVDTAYFHPSVAENFREEVRASNGIAQDVPLLLYVGSGFERKGVPQLLRAFAQMDNREARLVIVGADRKLKAMRQMATQLGLDRRVLFTVPVKDVRPWYGAADAFVLPTLYDPCPNAALEAMACGLPMLTSETCGAKVWVQDGENGFVVDAMDQQALANGLQELSRIALVRSSHAAAREEVENLSLGSMAEQLLKLYRGLH